MLLPTPVEAAQVPGVPEPVPVGKKTIRYDAANVPREPIGTKGAFGRTMLGLTPSKPIEPGVPIKAANEPAPGTPLVPSVGPKPTPDKAMHRTMLGLAPLAVQPAAPKKADQTLLGAGQFTTADPSAFPLKETSVPHATDQSSSAPRLTPDKAKHQTMLGMAPPVAVHPDAVNRADQTLQGAGSFTTADQPAFPLKVASTSTPDVTDQSSDGPRLALDKTKHQTMLGMAPPVAVHPDAVNRADQTLAGAGSFTTADPSAFPLKDAKKGTLIGVAVPGIAPINPGVAKAVPPIASVDDSPETAPDDEPFADYARSAESKVAASGRALLVTLSAAAAVLAVISLVAIWWWRTSPKINVQVRSDEVGNDSLVIDCANCDDGSQLTCMGVTAKMQNHQATIPMKSPLKIGQNATSISLVRRGARAEVIQLSVPVDFRVTGDMSGLSESPEKLRLRIEKTPQAEFEVNREIVHFDSTGKGLFELDVSSELEGPSAVETLLEKRVNYIVRSSAGIRGGAVLLRTGIVPLVVESPGTSLVTENSEFDICGHTSANARLQISGLQATVGADGKFCQTVAVRELGKFELWIRAQAPGLAPRRVKRTIERTPDLKAYAKALYPKVSHEITHGQNPAASVAPGLVALTGVVVERSDSPRATRYLLKCKSGSDSTVVRITSFARKSLASGAHVTVFGEPTGSLTGPDGRAMEEITSAFEVPALQ
jgi:hypothetical protein